MKLILSFKFCGLLSLIFVLELSAGITGYILKNSTYDLVKNALRPTMGDYTNVNKTHIAIGRNVINNLADRCSKRKIIILLRLGQHSRNLSVLWIGLVSWTFRLPGLDRCRRWHPTQLLLNSSWSTQYFQLFEWARHFVHVRMCSGVRWLYQVPCVITGPRWSHSRVHPAYRFAVRVAHCKADKKEPRILRFAFAQHSRMSVRL